MKALTLHQPWASLVALGVKRIETRSWRTNYRGPLAIHAGKMEGAAVTIGDWLYRESNLSGWELWPPGTGYQHQCHRMVTLPFGAVVATCELVDVVPIYDAGQRLDVAWEHHVGATRQGDLRLWLGPGDIENPSTGRLSWRTHDITNQRPYGDFTPRRFAWLLDDVRPLAEPIPAKGRQGLWECAIDLRDTFYAWADPGQAVEVALSSEWQEFDGPDGRVLCCPDCIAES